MTPGIAGNDHGLPKWWADWRAVVLTPSDGLAVQQIGDAFLACTPGCATRVLEPVQADLCTARAEGASLGEIAESVDTSTLPSELDPRAILVQVARALAEAGLVSLDPSPTVRVPHDDVPTATPRDGREVAFDPAMVMAPRNLARVEPTPGSAVPNSLVVTGAWVTGHATGFDVFVESRGLRIPPDAYWTDETRVDLDGTTLWVRRDDASIPRAGRTVTGPLGSISLAEETHDPVVRAAALCDVVRRDRTTSGTDAARLAVHLEESGRLRSVPILIDPAAAAEVPSGLADLQRIGELESLGRSTKIRPGELIEGRGAWSFHITDASPANLADAAEVLASFGVPHQVAPSIVELPGHDRRFVIGFEPGEAGRPERRKVYVGVTEPVTFAALTDLDPTFATLHGDTVISPDHPNAEPPRYVTWKSAGGRTPIRSIYRKGHDPSATVAAAIRRVVPTAPEWANAATALVGIERDTDAPLSPEDLEVIEEGGRRSIDVQLDDLAPRGARLEIAARLGHLAGIDAAGADVWAHQLARSLIIRIIVGTDGGGGPFLTVYRT